MLGVDEGGGRWVDGWVCGCVYGFPFPTFFFYFPS